jgi:hypothetical protein
MERGGRKVKGELLILLMRVNKMKISGAMFYILSIFVGLLWACAGILFSLSFQPSPYLLVDPIIAFFPFNILLLPWFLALISSRLLPLNAFLVNLFSLIYGALLGLLLGYFYGRLRG